MRGERRVVVTGLGCISPVGNDVAQAWDSVINGRSGIGPLTAFDAERFSCRIAGEIRDLELDRYMAPKDARKSDPFIHYGIAAAVQAIEDAGLPSEPLDPTRYGVAIGSGIGGIKAIEDTHQVYVDSGPRRISPFFVPSCIINMVAGHISIRYGYQGPNISVVTACTTGTHNIGEAARLIAYGDADVMVAGGSEFGTTPTAMGGFCAARAMSTRNDDPEAASRPWDQDRDGFVLGNGAGIVVLEELEHARARGARIYAELLGYGMSGDAHHITSPVAGGDGARRCMQAAIRDAEMAPEEIDYVNAHGTSTPQGDRAEIEAVRAAFGHHVEALAVSSTKSMTGHLLGAAGGIEAIFSILALHHGVIPPTINLDRPDEICAGINLVPHTAQERDIRVAISNSFGFGGTNGTILFCRPE
ncbi:MAG: beta-ketoacyl-[acyl-carrier-protein] synthase II [Gammaproteobacteria bacterium HGW-Gammaproteobacteria-8]|nr:MAG: beta-ketoacyl-[acyl-carrier-protein] synthase II [Gammaproteobacteria bacterium HGW-Gammaproteobacteria-8]